jgi:hypothetical protein
MRSPVVVSTPVEVVDEQPPRRAHQAAHCRRNSVKLSVVERHRGNDRVKSAQIRHLVDSLANQTQMTRSGWIQSQRVESELSKAVNEPAIATTDIEDPGARRQPGSDYLVEVLPSPRIGHTPERIPVTAART